jgi:hypothetical protein
MEKVSTLVTLKLIQTLTLDTVGHEIRKIDGRVIYMAGLVTILVHHYMLFSSTHFTDPGALKKEGTVSTCRTISGRGTILL